MQNTPTESFNRHTDVPCTMIAVSGDPSALVSDLHKYQASKEFLSDLVQKMEGKSAGAPKVDASVPGSQRVGATVMRRKLMQNGFN